MSKLDWRRASPSKPKLSVKDEAEYRSNDAAARWLARHSKQITQEVRASKQKSGSPEDARPEVNPLTNIASIVGETTLIPRPNKKFTAIPTIAYGGVIEMTPAEWATVQDNPRQRDTEAHARRATHLRTPHPSHAKVNMALLTDGTRVKLDGHTRSFMWHNGIVDAPACLYVDVWECRSLEFAKELYATFDSKSAVETAGDQLFGAIREKGIEFESDILVNNRFSSAMRFAYEMMFGQVAARTISMYDLLQYWQPELQLLDKCGPTRKRFPAAVVAGALITFRRFGRHATPFWEAYAKGEGWKSDGMMDAVQAYEERVLRRGSENRITGRAHISEIVRMTLSAFDRHRAGETYATTSSGIKTMTSDSAKKWLILAKTNKRAE